MITIKASFAECVDRLIYFTNPTIYTTKTIVLSKEDNSKDEIIQTLKDSLNFEFRGEHLECVVNRTEEEIQEQKQHAKNKVQYQITSLRKWCNMSEENKQQIFTYLKYKNLDWVIEQF